MGEDTYTAEKIHGGLGFGEGPRWHNDRLWFSDFYRRGIYSIAADGTGERLELAVPEQPSGLGWMPDGSLLFVSMIDNTVKRYDGTSVSSHCHVGEHTGFWSNEMCVSSTGVAYTGSFGFDLDTMLRDEGVGPLLRGEVGGSNLIVVAASGEIIQVVPDLMFPNGTVITPDGRTLIIAETMGTRLTAFDIAADGTLSNRRLFAQLEMVFADGICLDAEGQVWVSNAGAPQVVRVAEGGEITARVSTSQIAYACMLGGADRRDLFVITNHTSSRFELEGAATGAIERVRVEVAGAGLP